MKSASSARNAKNPDNMISAAFDCYGTTSLSSAGVRADQHEFAVRLWCFRFLNGTCLERRRHHPGAPQTSITSRHHPVCNSAAPATLFNSDPFSKKVRSAILTYHHDGCGICAQKAVFVRLKLTKWQTRLLHIRWAVSSLGDLRSWLAQRSSSSQSCTPIRIVPSPKGAQTGERVGGSPHGKAWHCSGSAPRIHDLHWNPRPSLVRIALIVYCSGWTPKIAQF